MCIHLSTEKCETHPGLLFFCAEVIRGEGRTASSPVLGPSTSASSLMLQYVKQRSCKQFLSLYLNILKRTENLHWFVSWFWNPVCLCSSAQVRKVKEHNPGVLVLFCWAAVGFRAFQVWFFWTELSEQVFSMQMVYFSSTCEPCLCKQDRRKLGVCHHSETSDKLLLCVPTTTCFGALSFFVYSVPLCFLLLESGQFKCPELKSGHLLHDLLLFTKAAEMYSLFGVGAGVTP